MTVPYTFTPGTVISSDEMNSNFSWFAGSSGSSGVGFIQSGTGAVARTVQDKSRGELDAFDFMTPAEIADVKAGTEVLDVTASLRKAAAELAARGGDLVLMPGTYRITGSISQVIGDGKNVRIRGYGAKINARAVSSGAAISLGGSRISSTPLGADVSKNSETFTVSSAGGMSAGRILLLTSTDLWNPTRPQYYKGELALIEKLVGTTVTNSNPLYDGYSAATTTVHLLDMPQVSVEGLEIECNADVIALQILYSRNPVVRNCNVHGSRYAGIYVGYCLGGTVDSNFIWDVWNGVITGTSYGVLVGTGQGVKVVNNTINNARHGISGGGFEPLREVVYANNACHNSTLENLVGCLDVHGNVEFAIIQGNVASSINCAAINCIFADNIINNAEGSVPGILIYQEINSDYYIFKGNRVSCVGAASNGIWVSPHQPNLNISNLLLSGNVITSSLQAIFISPRTSADTGCSITNLTVLGNTAKSTGAAQGFAFSNNGAATYALTNLVTGNNIYEAATHDAFACTGNPITSTDSTGDVFKANRLNGSLAYFGGTDVRLTSPSFYGNTGGAGNSRSIYYANTGRITVTNPVFKNMTYKAEIAAAAEYVENGWSSLTPGILNTGTARLVNFYGAGGAAIAYSTAAPTTKTWAVGDRVFNSAPVVGQPKSWVCTVAGTPGTWVSEGNL